MADGVVLDLGGKRVRHIDTPHVPHGSSYRDDGGKALYAAAIAQASSVADLIRVGLEPRCPVDTGRATSGRRRLWLRARLRSHAKALSMSGGTTWSRPLEPALLLTDQALTGASKSSSTT
jgi:glyoxylase-like metal-dependent hydrolase (beta-lactamase superfamily II)